MAKIILASASPRRSELLRAAGVKFSVETAKVNELSDAFDPRELPCANARLKAEAVFERHPDSIVIGADTVVLYRDQIFGKPRGREDAHRMLQILSGHTHEVLTGVAVLAPPDIHEYFTESTQVTFKALSEEDIDSYLNTVDVLDKAGAYAIQEHGDFIIGSILGSQDNVIGLPVAPLLKVLDRL